MKVLMTGATGWIGRSLGLELARRGHELVCPVRDVERARLECPFPATWIAWPHVEAPLEEGALAGVEAVVHLLGEPIDGARWSAPYKQKIFNSRVRSTRKLGELVRRRRIPAFVSASAIGFYGDRGEEELGEEDAPGAGFLAEVCQDWEAEVLAAGPDARCVALRVGIVLGRDGGALAGMVPAFELGLGGRFASGSQWMSWIHIQDLVRLFVVALEDKRYHGIVNAVAPVPVRQRDFSAALGACLGRGARWWVPGAVLRVALGEMAGLLLGSTRVLPRRALGLGFSFSFPALREALEEILAAERAGERELRALQFIPKPLGEVFAFYGDERNLEAITPPFLHFKVLGKSTSEVERGSLIDYRLRLHGIPFGWRTLIEEWEAPRAFVDTQIRGPYRKWRHLHRFEEIRGGTLIEDTVRYRLPLGGPGNLLAGWKVKRDLAAIFSYRRKATWAYFQK